MIKKMEIVSSTEVNADLIDNVNEKWKKQRERSDTLKAVIKML